jgi:hypothetical protein
MDEFINTQRNFGALTAKSPNGLIGGRMYRSIDGTTAVLVSQFESAQAQEEIRQSAAFKEHLSRVQALVESASPALYEEAYTSGEFK